MDKAEYERTKKAIEDGYEAGTELLRKARDRQLQALEIIRMSTPGFEPVQDTGRSTTSSSSAPETGPLNDAVSPSKQPGEVEERIKAALEHLEDSFTQPQVTKKLEELGTPIPRGTVGAALRRMAESGEEIRELEKGRGRRATVYERVKTEAALQ